MSLTQLSFKGLNKVENLTAIAVMRLTEFEPPEGYYLAFSGGKDSVVIYDLAVKAGVKFDAHYTQGGIDPPELVYFIRQNYHDLIIEKPPMSIWKAIEKKGMPTRVTRWCCEMIKESKGQGRRIVMGIRWAESSRRAKRRMFEVCQKDKTRYFLNPIIDWSTHDVWDYIHVNNLPYCSLYDEGFTRLGCILCPMLSPKKTQIELKRFPKIAEAWKRACFRYYEKEKDGVKRWSTPEFMWEWWLSRKGEPKVNKSQCILFDN